MVGNPPTEPQALIKERGAFHVSQSLDGLNYKEEYRVGDTIPLNSQSYLLKGIDRETHKMTLELTGRQHAFHRIDKNLLDYFLGYFKSKEYLY